MRRGWLAFLAGTVLGLTVGLLARLPQTNRAAHVHLTAYQSNRAHAASMLSAHQAEPSYVSALRAAQAYARVMELCRRVEEDRIIPPGVGEEARRLGLDLALDAEQRARGPDERERARNVVSRLTSE